MSGDHGPAVVLPAAEIILQEHAGLSLLLVGDEAVVGAQVKALSARFPGRVEFIHAEQVVGMV